MNTGKEAIYGGTGGLPKGVLTAVQVVAIVFLIFTCVVVFNYLPDRKNDCWKVWFYICWIWWVFMPPIWFSVEYFVLYKPSKKEGTFEAFKYGQELASRTWFGIAAVLTVIASE